MARSLQHKPINIGDTNQNMSQTVATPQKFLEKNETFLLPGATQTVNMSVSLFLDSLSQKLVPLPQCLEPYVLIYEPRQLQQCLSS